MISTMQQLWLVAAIVGALVLAACGGGGSSSSSSPPPPPPTTTPRTTLYFGYFGSVDNATDSQLPSGISSIAETARHVNLLFEAGWGDWSTPAGRQDVTSRIIRRLNEAKAAGINSAIITVDYLLYTGLTKGATYRGSDVAKAELRTAFNQFQTAGMLGMIVAIYPIDEPDNVGLSDEMVTLANADVRSVMGEFFELRNAKLAVIYGNKGKITPRFASYDWVGFDDYDSRTAIFSNGEYDSFRQRLSATQHLILVPGGADNWKTDPTPFYTKAQADLAVVAIVGFIWFDNWDLSQGFKRGIRSNGMRLSYCGVGSAVKGVPNACQ